MYCILNAVDGTDDDEMALKRMGMLGVSVRKMEALTVKMEMVKVDRIWHALCIECMRLIVKYFFSACV
jgi:hypothetical protein